MKKKTIIAQDNYPSPFSYPSPSPNAGSPRGNPVLHLHPSNIGATHPISSTTTPTTLNSGRSILDSSSNSSSAYYGDAGSGLYSNSNRNLITQKFAPVGIPPSNSSFPNNNYDQNYNSSTPFNRSNGNNSQSCGAAGANNNASSTSSNNAMAFYASAASASPAATDNSHLNSNRSISGNLYKSSLPSRSHDLSPGAHQPEQANYPTAHGASLSSRNPSTATDSFKWNNSNNLYNTGSTIESLQARARESLDAANKWGPSRDELKDQLVNSLTSDKNITILPGFQSGSGSGGNSTGRPSQESLLPYTNSCPAINYGTQRRRQPSYTDKNKSSASERLSSPVSRAQAAIGESRRELGQVQSMMDMNSTNNFYNGGNGNGTGIGSYNSRGNHPRNKHFLAIDNESFLSKRSRQQSYRQELERQIEQTRARNLEMRRLDAEGDHPLGVKYNSLIPPNYLDGPLLSSKVPLSNFPSPFAKDYAKYIELMTKRDALPDLNPKPKPQPFEKPQPRQTSRQQQQQQFANSCHQQQQQGSLNYNNQFSELPPTPRNYDGSPSSKTSLAQQQQQFYNQHQQQAQAQFYSNPYYQSYPGYYGFPSQQPSVPSNQYQFPTSSPSQLQGFQSNSARVAQNPRSIDESVFPMPSSQIPQREADSPSSARSSNPSQSQMPINNSSSNNNWKINSGASTPRGSFNSSALVMNAPVISRQQTSSEKSSRLEFDDVDSDSLEDMEQSFLRLHVWQESDQMPDTELKTNLYKRDLMKQISQKRKEQLERRAKEKEDDEKLEKKILDYQEQMRREVEEEKNQLSRRLAGKHRKHDLSLQARMRAIHGHPVNEFHHHSKQGRHHHHHHHHHSSEKAGDTMRDAARSTRTPRSKDLLKSKELPTSTITTIGGPGGDDTVDGGKDNERSVSAETNASSESLISTATFAQPNIPGITLPTLAHNKSSRPAADTFENGQMVSSTKGKIIQDLKLLNNVHKILKSEAKRIDKVLQGSPKSNHSKQQKRTVVKI